MILWETEYRDPDGPRYVSQVIAPTRRAAQRLCRLRGLGEKVEGQLPHEEEGTPVSTIVARALKLVQRGTIGPRQSGEVFHAMAFFGYLAMRSRRADAHALMSDDGLMHTVAHVLHHPNLHKKKIPEIVDRLRTMERRIPGYPYAGWRNE